MYYCLDVACVVHCPSRLAAAGLPLKIRRRLLRRLAPTELALLARELGLEGGRLGLEGLRALTGGRRRHLCYCIFFDMHACTMPRMRPILTA